MVRAQFSIGFSFSISFTKINTLISQVKFYIIKAKTLFLLYFTNINRLKVSFNNL
jgi:hypothetical protein